MFRASVPRELLQMRGLQTGFEVGQTSEFGLTYTPFRVEKAHRCSKSGDLYCRVHFKLMEEKQTRKMLEVEENNNNDVDQNQTEEVSEI